MLKKIIQYVPGVAVPMIINFVLTMLYAAYLTPGEYGKLNIYLNTIQIIYALTLSIFQNASLRLYSSEDVHSDKEYVTTYVISTFTATAIACILMALTGSFVSYNWRLIAMSIGCNGMFQFFCNYYRVTGKSRKYNRIKCVAAILALIVLVAVEKQLRVLTYIWPVIAVYGCYGLISLYVIFDARKSFSINAFSLTLVKKSLRYGIPLIGVSVLGYIIASCDQYFLLYYLGEEAVGNYALGHRLVDAVITNLLMMVLLVMTPELNKVHDLKGEKESSYTLEKMIDTAFWIILPITFAIIVYSKYIIIYLFPEYDSAAHIMQLVVFASMFHGLSMFTCKGLELIKRTEYIFIGLLFATAINCLYNLIFIPIYGIDASAHSSMVSYIFYNMYLVLKTKKYYRIVFDWKYILKTFAATAVTVIVAIYLMNWIEISGIVSLALEAAVCGSVYIMLSYGFKLTKIFF